MTAVDGIKTEVTLAGNTYVQAGSEPVIDGNIVTVWRTPFYHVWTRAFLKMLRERGILPESETPKAKAAGAR